MWKSAIVEVLAAAFCVSVCWDGFLWVKARRRSKRVSGDRDNIVDLTLRRVNVSGEVAYSFTVTPSIMEDVMKHTHQKDMLSAMRHVVKTGLAVHIITGSDDEALELRNLKTGEVQRFVP